MSDPGSITQWIVDVRQGNSVAAVELWNRYYRRLVGLARKKLYDAPRRMADEEDVVVNAFDSFCRGVEGGRFPQLDDRDDLWQVLVMLTARKAADQLKYQTRQKRGGTQIAGELATPTADSAEERTIDQIVGSEPTPEFAAQVAEQCQLLLNHLDDSSLCEVAVAKMEGYTNSDIAERLGVKTRTIERKLRIIREIWSAHSD